MWFVCLSFIQNEQSSIIRKSLYFLGINKLNNSDILITEMSTND